MVIAFKEALTGFLVLFGLVEAPDLAVVVVAVVTIVIEEVEVLANPIFAFDYFSLITAGEEEDRLATIVSLGPEGADFFPFSLYSNLDFQEVVLISIDNLEEVLILVEDLDQEEDLIVILFEEGALIMALFLKALS